MGCLAIVLPVWIVVAAPRWISIGVVRQHAALREELADERRGDSPGPNPLRTENQHFDFLAPASLKTSTDLAQMFRPLASSLRPKSRISFKRTYASTLDGSVLSPFRVFDREVKRMQKDRAAAFKDGELSRTVDYVRNEVADRLSERFTVRLPLPCQSRYQLIFGMSGRISSES